MRFDLRLVFAVGVLLVHLVSGAGVPKGSGSDAGDNPDDSDGGTDSGSSSGSRAGSSPVTGSGDGGASGGTAVGSDASSNAWDLSGGGVKQAQILEPVGNVEEDLREEEEEDSEAIKDLLEKALDALKDILDALQNTTTTTTPSPTLTLTSSSSTLPSVKATTTIPVTAFEPCQDFSSIVSLCTSSTGGWLSQPTSVQASCACYEVNPGLDGIGGLYATTIFAPSMFDDAVSGCYGYFQTVGYTDVASLLSQNAGGFCSKAGDVIASAAAASTTTTSASPATTSSVAPSPTSTSNPSTSNAMAKRPVGLWVALASLTTMTTFLISSFC